MDKLGIAQEFSFEDHDAIYSYADYSAPIKTIDASIAPPAVTEYPEYPLSEFSTPPAFNVAVAVDRNKKSAQDTVLPATASRDSSRLIRLSTEIVRVPRMANSRFLRNLELAMREN